MIESSRTEAEYIKSRVRMEDVIVRYHHKGQRRGRTSCPFHGGVNDNLGYDAHRFHCFKCGASGDVITFVERINNVSFKDAVRMFDSDFGVGLSTIDRAERERFESERKQRDIQASIDRYNRQRAHKIFVLFTHIIRWIRNRKIQTPIHASQVAFLERQVDFVMDGGIFTSDPVATARAVAQRVRAAEKEIANAG